MASELYSIGVINILHVWFSVSEITQVTQDKNTKVMESLETWKDPKIHVHVQYILTLWQNREQILQLIIKLFPHFK